MSESKTGVESVRLLSAYLRGRGFFNTFSIRGVSRGMYEGRHVWDTYKGIRLHGVGKIINEHGIVVLLEQVDPVSFDEQRPFAGYGLTISRYVVKRHIENTKTHLDPLAKGNLTCAYPVERRKADEIAEKIKKRLACSCVCLDGLLSEVSNDPGHPWFEDKQTTFFTHSYE